MSRTVFEQWLASSTSEIGPHSLVCIDEIDGIRSEILGGLRDLVKNHYSNPEFTARRLESLGAPKTAELLRELLPTRKKARSGDLGEIFATEIAESKLKYAVPIRRLQWKDGREMALRGDDILGIIHKSGVLWILKGESKSRVALSRAVINEASDALNRDQGRPTRHSVIFVAERLRDKGNHILAEELEQAVLSSFHGIEVEHMLFVLCGNKPQALLDDHLLSIQNEPHKRHAVGLRIADHGDFIRLLYEGFK